MLNRNLLCCQWGYKEGDWPSKRIHCETVGVGDRPVCGDGNNTRWRLYGEVSGEKIHVDFLNFDHGQYVICFFWRQFFFLNEYRGVFVLILGWIIKLLKLPKKLYRNLKSLILGNVRFLWLLLWHYEFIDIAFFFMVICLDGSLSVHWTLRNFFCVYVWQNPPCAHPSSGLAVVVKFLFLFRI